MSAIFGLAHAHDADGVEQDREDDQGGGEGRVSRFHQTPLVKSMGVDVGALRRRAAVGGSIMREASLRLTGRQELPMKSES